MRSPLSLEVRLESYPLKAPFRISGYTFTKTDVVVVEPEDGEQCGLGAACGVYYFNETPDHMAAALNAQRTRIAAGWTLADAQDLLPPGGARNALDCALWHLRSKQAGRTADAAVLFSGLDRCAERRLGPSYMMIDAWWQRALAKTDELGRSSFKEIDSKQQTSQPRHRRIQHEPYTHNSARDDSRFRVWPRHPAARCPRPSR